MFIDLAFKTDEGYHRLLIDEQWTTELFCVRIPLSFFVRRVAYSNRLGCYENEYL